MKTLKKDIDENKQNIFKNLCSIQRNAEAIVEIKDGTEVYNNMLCRQDTTIKRLIVALCIAIIAIMLSNAIWLLVLSAKGVWEDNPRFVPFEEWQDPFRYRCPECEKVSYAHTPFCPYCGIRLIGV